jgi:hypothetical protein
VKQWKYVAHDLGLKPQVGASLFNIEGWLMPHIGQSLPKCASRQKLGNKQNLNYTIKLSATLITPNLPRCRINPPNSDA